SDDPHLREYGVAAAAVLIDCTEDAAWEITWPVIQDNPEFGKHIFTSLHRYRHSPSPKTQEPKQFIAERIGALASAELYIWLAKQFPLSGARQLDDSKTVTANDDVAQYREAILSHIASQGS